MNQKCPNESYFAEIQSTGINNNRNVKYGIKLAISYQDFAIEVALL